MISIFFSVSQCCSIKDSGINHKIFKIFNTQPRNLLVVYSSKQQFKYGYSANYAESITWPCTCQKFVHFNLLISKLTIIEKALVSKYFQSFCLVFQSKFTWQTRHNNKTLSSSTSCLLCFKRVGSYFQLCIYEVMDALWKFGEHLRSQRSLSCTPRNSYASFMLSKLLMCIYNLK